MADPTNKGSRHAIEKTVTAFIECTDTARREQNLDHLTDEQLAAALTAAIKLYAARAELTGRHPPPLTDDATATDAVIAVTAFMRFADLNAFDVNMWLSRFQDN